MNAWLAVPLLSVIALTAERLLFGPFAIWQQGPDLLLVALLGLATGRKHAAAAALGFTLGLTRDVFGVDPPGTFTLSYLISGLVLVELGQVVWIPGAVYRVGMAGLLALLAGGVIMIVSWATSDVSLFAPLGAVVISAVYTAAAAGLVLWGVDTRRR